MLTIESRCHGCSHRREHRYVAWGDIHCDAKGHTPPLSMDEECEDYNAKD